MSPAKDASGRFGARLVRAIAEQGPLCVGLDPHPQLLNDWGLTDSADGIRTFSMTVLEAVAGTCAAIKPQSAFYERHGSAGIAVLEEVLAFCRDRGILTVLDVKRGDIGSTLTAYAQAYLADGAPLAADSITLNPYLGYGALRPAIDLARESGRGVWILGLTSNPEGAQVQQIGSPSVAARIMADVNRDNADICGDHLSDGTTACGDIGLVVGATLGKTLTGLGIDLAASNAPILTPGVGAQGATAADIAENFSGCAGRLLVPISRALLATGPEPEDIRTSAESWSAASAVSVGVA